MRRFDLVAVLSSPAPALVAALAATLTHAVVITVLVPLVAPGSLAGHALVTWVAIMLPGVAVLAFSRGARSRWWRPVAVWALMYTAFGQWPLLILIVGQTWWWYRSLCESGSRYREAELAAGSPAA